MPEPAWSALALPAGFVLDALLGDPRGWPHPVRLVGRVIGRTERVLRVMLARFGRSQETRSATASGVILALVVTVSTGFAAWAFLALGSTLGPWGRFLGESLLVYWGLAVRSLGVEALRASDAPDLEQARAELAMIVGRDTEHLDRAEICRACVETVAENGNDAVVAPLFWYALTGPLGLWLYKSVNTLDSMVGYRNSRYRHFGWASARLDDLVNLTPARLTWVLIAAGALWLGERPIAALRIGWRDGRKHPSPNAAWGEAAMAGALSIQLGGPATYQGVPGAKPRLGDPGDPIGPATVRRAVKLLWAVALLAAGLATVVRWLIVGRA